MEQNVGFTPGCRDCWLDNIQCSFNYCKFTCIKYKMFRQQNNNGDDVDLRAPLLMSSDMASDSANDNAMGNARNDETGNEQMRNLEEGGP